MQLIEQGQVVIPTRPMIKGSRPFYWILLKEANLYSMWSNTHMSHVVRKPAFAYAKTKTQISFAVTAKLISAFVFCYTDSTFPLLPKYGISSLYASSVIAQPGLCWTWSETPKTVFSHRGSYVIIHFQPVNKREVIDLEPSAKLVSW